MIRFFFLNTNGVHILGDFTVCLSTYKDFICTCKAELFLNSDNFKEIFYLIDIPK